MNFALVLLIIFSSTFIRSAFGFGNALIVMPLLVLILGTKIAAPLVALVGIVIALVMLLRDWRELDFQTAVYLILSTLVGIPLGLFFLKSTPPTKGSRITVGRIPTRVAVVRTVALSVVLVTPPDQGKLHHLAA